MSPNLEELKLGPAETGAESIILKRWSPRAFADKPVSDAHLKTIFSAAAWAASSFNEQPWRFLVGHHGDPTYTKILESLGEFNQAWAKSAPILILTVAKTHFSHNNSPNGAAIHDLGAASATMCLQAIALGLHTHGMAGFDKHKARELFAIPADFEIGVVWALGYLGDPESLPPHFKERELEPRTRKPLEEIVFTTWEQPAAL